MAAAPADISAHDMYGPESPQKRSTAPVFVRWVLPAGRARDEELSGPNRGQALGSFAFSRPPQALPGPSLGPPPVFPRPHRPFQAPGALLRGQALFEGPAILTALQRSASTATPGGNGLGGLSLFDKEPLAFP